jgi:hypothetical protein
MSGDQTFHLDFQFTGTDANMLWYFAYFAMREACITLVQH